VGLAERGATGGGASRSKVVIGAASVGACSGSSDVTPGTWNLIEVDGVLPASEGSAGFDMGGCVGADPAGATSLLECIEGIGEGEDGGGVPGIEPAPAGDCPVLGVFIRTTSLINAPELGRAVGARPVLAADRGELGSILVLTIA
jgi:hypothetical protein